MTALRFFKESNPCQHCGRSYPHYVMEFTAPPPGQFSVSRLAGSRCTLEVLTQAMKSATLLCANCHKIHSFNHHKK